MEDEKPVSELNLDKVTPGSAREEAERLLPSAPIPASVAAPQETSPNPVKKASESVPINSAGPADEVVPDWLNDKRPTPAIKVLLALNITIFVGMTAFALNQSATASNGTFNMQSIIGILLALPADTLLLWGANAATVTVLDHQYWRLITNTFLHQNLLHLGMNMYVLWDFNRLLERLYGSSKFIVIYLLSGLGSSMCSLLFLDPTSISAGASGAIFGVFGATVAFFWAFRKDFPKKLFRMYQKMFFMFIIYCVVSSMMFPGMDNAAHLGGFIVGLWTALCLLPTNVASRSWAKGNFLKLACLTLVLVAGLELDIRTSRDNPKVQGELEYRRAIDMLKHEKFDDALVQLNKAAQLTPQNADLYKDEAVAYSKLKRHQEAIEAATRALKINPKLREAIAARAAAYHNLGEEQKSVDEYNRLIQTDPRSAVAYNNRAWSYNALNLPDNAIADSTKSMQLDGQGSAAYDTRGVAYVLKHDYNRAIEDFGHFIQLKPSEGAVYYHRAYANFEKGYIESAKADLAKAKSLSYQLEPWEAKKMQDLFKLEQ